MTSVTNIQGSDIQHLVEKLTSVTSKHDAFEILGAYLSDVAVGIHHTPFDYTTSFPAQEPTCVPKFTRNFVHSDWRDGQDLVQAEQTSGEDGFNLRFHRIEQDLDALADDVKTAFHCVEEMRAALAAILGELKAAINIVQADVATLENQGRSVGPVLTAQSVNQGKILGSVKWFDQNMVAFETPQGISLLPQVGPIDGTTDPRIDRVSALGALLESNAKIKNGFRASPVKTQDLVKSFGTITANGYTFADLVDILPPDATFSSPDALLKAVAEREAAAIRTGGRADELLAEIGGADSAPAAATKLDGYEVIPTEARTALIAAGVGTVGDLGARKPADVAALLKKAGVSASAATTAGWIAGARTVTLIR